MIISRLMGGMGNQMFQYAFGRYLAHQNQSELKLDISMLGKQSDNPNAVYREYDLDVFALEPSFASREELWRFTGRPSGNLGVKINNRLRKWLGPEKMIIQHGNTFESDWLEARDPACIAGRFQSEIYFKPIEQIIRNDFEFRNPLDEKCSELAQKISDSDSVCIHVRRGDYVDNKLYAKILGFIGLDYYEKSVKYLKNNTDSNLHLYIFSDDLEWCREHFQFDLPLTVVGAEYEGPKVQYYLQLMTLCKYFIIPNSTFSWWAAWLGKREGKRVIAPQKWSADGSLEDEKIVPEDWIRL